MKRQKQRKQKASAVGSATYRIEVDEPIIETCESLLSTALKFGAQGMHLVPNSGLKFVAVHLVAANKKEPSLVVFPNRLYRAIVSRFKIMANLSIAEQRTIQFGCFKPSSKSRMCPTFKMVSFPTVLGENLLIALR